MWLSNVSKYIFLGPFPSFHIIILTNLLFGHLRMNTNVSETMAVAIIFLNSETILGQLNKLYEEHVKLQ